MGQNTSHRQRIAVMMSAERFREVLRTRFREIDEEVTADEKLKHMKQKGPASVHVAMFQRIAAPLNWGEEALASTLYGTLKEEVKDEIARMRERPKTLDAMASEAIAIDNQQHARHIERKGYRPVNVSNAKKPKKEADPYGP